MPLKKDWGTGQSFTAADANDLADSVVQWGVNVKDYGAVGDGAADDTAEIQAAIIDAPVGGTVYFPEGTYKVSSAIVVDQSVRLSGTGASTLKLNALINILSVEDTSDVVIDGLRFDGNRTALGGNGYAAVYLTDVSQVAVRNCTFTDTQSAALTITRGASIWVSGNRFSEIYDSGVRLEDPTSGEFNDYIWITENHFDACQLSGTNGTAAIQAHGTGEVSHRHIFVLGNVINLPELVGIGLDSLDNSTVIGNTVTKDATVSNGECIAFTGSENLVSGNYCHNDSTSSGAAILLWAVAGRTNAQNQIVDNRCTNGGQGVAFVWGETGAAISDLLITGNHCYENNRGIQSYIAGGVSSGSQSRVLITHNDFAGNTTEAFNLVHDSVTISGNPEFIANVGAWGTQRVATPAPSATPAIDTDSTDLVVIYGLNTNITSMTTNLTGTPNDGDRLTVRIQDNGTARTITWGAMFIGTLLATTTAPGGGAWKTHVQELMYDAGQSKWAGTFVNTTGY
jgi:hypothetical protein